MNDSTTPLDISGFAQAFHSLAEAAPDAIIVSNATGTILYSNPSSARILGYGPQELTSQPLHEIIPPRFREAHFEGMNRYLQTGVARILGKTIELMALKKDGSEIPIELSLSSWKYNSETFVSAIIRDISDRKRNEAALRKQSSIVQLLQNVTAAANEAPTIEQSMLACLELVCNHTKWPLGHVCFLSENMNSHELTSSDLWFPAREPQFELLLKYSGGTSFFEGTGLPGRVLLSGQAEWISDLAEDPNLPRRSAMMKCGLKSGFAFPVLVGPRIVAVMEFFSLVHAGYDADLLSIMVPVGVQLGRVVERNEASRLLLDAALRDPLTGLPNRTALLDAIRRGITHFNRRKDYSFAVLYIDLDRFKIINDSLGHEAGDLLLVQLAQRLEEYRRGPDLVARLGGDEFAVFIDDLHRRSDGSGAVKIAERILAQIKKPCIIHDDEVFTSASIGVSFASSGYTEPEELLRDADTAMYRAKNAGKGRVEVFDPEMRAKVLTQLQLENDLRRAVNRGEFFLNFQPQVSLRSQHIVGFEALVRWKHPSRGVVQPDDFIPMAEETGLIVQMGEWVLMEACRWMSDLQKKSEPARSLTINVNVSAMEFGAGYLDKVEAVLEASGLNPRCLRLEITESSLLSSGIEMSSVAMARLRELGIELLVDDFGTGYSSLARLARLPINALKIDRSFIADMASNESNAEIARYIIALAAALRIKVIAEGVETVHDADALLQMGCDLAQGFYFGRPVDSYAAAAIVATLV